MNTKLILLGSIALISGSMAQACRLTISNDTAQTVILQSHKEREDRLKLIPGHTSAFGEQIGVENHGEMADFDVTFVNSKTEPTKVKQVKCNEPLYKTHIKISEILNKKFVGENEKLFTFDAKAAITCGG